MAATVPVGTIQQALTVWYRNGPDPARVSPGPVDGRWGPRTEQALRRFVRYAGARTTPQITEAMLHDAMRGTRPGASTLDVPAPLAEDLFDLSRSYPASQATQPTAPTAPARDADLAPVPRAWSPGKVILGAVVGAAVFGGLAWYLTRD